MLSLVITMAGEGSRFREAGYASPKPRIQVKGKTLREWALDSLDSLATPGCRVVFVDRVGRSDAAELRSLVARWRPGRVDLVELPSSTDGQATTTLHGLETAGVTGPFVVYNIDTHIRPGSLRPPDQEWDGWIPCFEAPGDHWSFVQATRDGVVERVAEKSRISNWASVGLYGFRSPAMFREAYTETYAHDAQITERYIAPIYNWMVDQGMTVRMTCIPFADVVPLGTPQEVERFAAS